MNAPRRARDSDTAEGREGVERHEEEGENRKAIATAIESRTRYTHARTYARTDTARVRVWVCGCATRARASGDRSIPRIENHIYQSLVSLPSNYLTPSLFQRTKYTYTHGRLAIKAVAKSLG